MHACRSRPPKCKALLAGWQVLRTPTSAPCSSSRPPARLAPLADAAEHGAAQGSDQRTAPIGAHPDRRPGPCFMTGGGRRPADRFTGAFSEGLRACSAEVRSEGACRCVPRVQPAARAGQPNHNPLALRSAASRPLCRCSSTACA